MSEILTTLPGRWFGYQGSDGSVGVVSPEGFEEVTAPEASALRGMLTGQDGDDDD